MKLFLLICRALIISWVIYHFATYKTPLPSRPSWILTPGTGYDHF